MKINPKLLSLAKRSKEASRKTAMLSDEIKKRALKAASKALVEFDAKILAANAKDMALAKKKKYPASYLDRLFLDAGRVEAMARALEEIAAQKDPVGEVVEEWNSKDGIKIKRVRSPLGVIGMIYESRPNVTVEAAALCLKAGNSVILRGGSESLNSNKALADIFSAAIASQGVPADAVLLIENTERKNIYDLAGLDEWVDLIIARGSEEMVNDIQKRATVPVLGHGKGVCHVFVDKSAALVMAEDIVLNAKTQRPGVCNAMETLLVHSGIAKGFLPAVGIRLAKAGVALRGDDASRKLIPGIQKATEKDWPAEYLDLILAVKVVDSVDQAVDHINRYGSGHTDTIVTEDASSAERFLKGVDSAAVFHNLSTRMHDGGVFGLGAEIGISTAKLHARGTTGARELTTTKYIAEGTGQIRK
ncbi:MAG: glutamate-5-semialdehyde dehydrogenase [Elusimicrobia bacterium RIFCSPLOWO2_01_FULL_54_10]|nr:MAG: glutamate-5-semialdehyde dehydrogenase [Elusimicrobia bacterium RIFCSPLOWO2_01_FULL_54_10]